MKLVLLHTVLQMWKQPQKAEVTCLRCPRGSVGIHSWVGLTSGVVDPEPLVTGDCLSISPSVNGETVTSPRGWCSNLSFFKKKECYQQIVKPFIRDEMERATQHDTCSELKAVCFFAP